VIQLLNDSRKKIVYKALTFTFAILFFSILVAVLLVNWQKSDIDNAYIEINNDAQEIKLFSMFYDSMITDSNSCSLMDKQLKGLADKAFQLGQKVDLYFEQNKDSDDAKDIQKEHVYLDLELWLRLQNFNKVCYMNRNYILYFYPYNCSECAPLAESIRDYKDNFGDNLWVFSIPAQIDSKIVEVLLQHYNADYLPSIVVNGYVLKGPEAFKDINMYLI